jgi:hypothetical protein
MATSAPRLPGGLIGRKGGQGKATTYSENGQVSLMSMFIELLNIMMWMVNERDGIDV